MSVSCLVILDECISKTIEYCHERQAFGKPIINNQYIHFRLAEMQTEIESLRALIYRTCEKLIDGNDVTYLASMAKLKSGRLLREVSDICLQFWGGMGITWENYKSKMIIFPAIDIKGGKCVRLLKGDFNKITKY